jgi:protein SCO1/2
VFGPVTLMTQSATQPAFRPLSRKLQATVFGALFLLIAAIALMYAQSPSRKSDFPVLQSVAPFHLTNQLGQAVSLKALDGKVWIADIIFSRCAGPCPRITKLMGSLQSAFTQSDPVQLVSLTTDPGYDTPAILNKYAARFSADSNRWWFLTGEKTEIANLAGKSLLLTGVEKTPEQQTTDTDLFIHSTIFVLVDKHGRLRASFETDDPQAPRRIVAAARDLLREH